MNKTNQVTTSASATSFEQFKNKKSKQKIRKVKLPTPPPDPTKVDDETNLGKTDRTVKDKEAEFLEYLESLQRCPRPSLSRSTSAFAPAIAAEDAFDHLDKLYKLMEQMLTLREQNVILHRRIMDLEHFRNVQDMHRELESAENLEDVPVYDPDSVFAENFLYNILTGTKKETKHKVSIRLGQTLLRKSQGVRNQTVNIDKDTDSGQSYDRKLSVATSMGNKQSKVSKWTKVKAAFKWEKASQIVSDAKSQDSGLGGMLPVNYEVARYLRVPSTSEELGTSPADSGAAEISTPATISSASSIEEMHRHGRRKTHEDTSDDDELFSFKYIPISKDEPSTSLNRPLNNKSHRTPWAKMKDILQTQTRNSFKKKHRLSAKSDDIKIDDSIASDNEEVFEPEEPKSPILIIQSPEEINRENEALSLEHNIPVDIIARYRVVNGDNGKEFQGRHISKWSKVKRAFLTSPSISRNGNTSPVSNPELPTIKRDANATKESDEKLHAEIQRNYIELQKKLSLEFQEKLQEWERSKLSSPCTSLSSNTQMNMSSIDDTKDVAFKKKMEEWEKIKGQSKHNMQLQSEINLPPEFRKKLEEWKKIKKTSMKEDSVNKKKIGDWPRWKSVGGHRVETNSETQPLSDEFLKKYEVWKQIKSGVAVSDELSDVKISKGNKSPSPRMGRKEINTRQSKKMKDQTDKELQWFEKELSKIEREKQRLERDRQKFLDREERLSKLRRSVIGGTKKEILVHTPSGFYRFEGISRNFTQKLYEWEKSQGIGPEKSTFALLQSSCIPHIKSSSASLIRSKSADSLMGPDTNIVYPLSHQPSSLSLNDVDSFEKDIRLRSSSVPDISEPYDIEEPEALIIEVEDVVEETASPLEHYLEKHFAIYQKQENNNMCEGEAKLAPTIRRSESTRAQTNYNLIEQIIKILQNLVENEKYIENIESSKMITDSIIIISSDDDNDAKTLKDKQEQQKDSSGILIDKLILLQEANTTVTSNITKEESHYTISRLADMLDTVQDISSELFNLAEIIDRSIYKRNKNQLESDTINSTKNLYPQISETLTILNYKILELRRSLSYICAASDTTAPPWKKKLQRSTQRGPLRKIPSLERKRSMLRKTRSAEASQEKYENEILDEAVGKYTKNTSSRNDLNRQVEQGAIKKRIRYRQKGMHSKTLDESDDDDESPVEPRKPKPRRMRSQNSTESNKSQTEKNLTDKESEKNPEEKEVSPLIVDPEVIEKVVVPTKTTNFSNFEDSVQNELNDSPVTVFVKTTRKLFTPIVTSGVSQEKITQLPLKNPILSSVLRRSLSPPDSPLLPRKKRLVHDTIQRDCTVEDIPDVAKIELNTNDSQSQTNNISRLPPLPASPTPQRKVQKDISPNIRLMMVRYNQKIFEETGAPARSGGSSGSASPTTWRSPVLERRVKAQTEKYQQDLQNLSPLLGGRREVQKSASMGVVVSGNKQVTVHGRSPEDSPKNSRGILKSSSTGGIIQSAKSDNIHVFNPIPEVENDKKEKSCLRLMSNPISISNTSISTLSDARNTKIQRAKEEFLNSPTPSSAPTRFSRSDHSIKYPIKNRLSQISVGSESSCNSYDGCLIKSASAGMINIDPDAYKQFDTEIHGGGYVSLPRTKKNTESLLSNITSKFRKVKMRRHKEANKMNVVSTLCRQSLLVDIHTDGSQETLSEDQSKLSVPSDSRGSSSVETSPSTSRTGSWIRRTKIFKLK